MRTEAAVCLSAIGAALRPLGAGTGGIELVFFLIVLGGRVSKQMDAGGAVAIGMTIAAAAITPYALIVGGVGNFAMPLLLPCLAMALFSSALPYALELRALRLLPGRTFSVLMSLEPAIAALCGLALLGEQLTATQWAAVALVVVASAGAAFSVAGRSERITA